MTVSFLPAEPGNCGTRPCAAKRTNDKEAASPEGKGKQPNARNRQGVEMG